MRLESDFILKQDPFQWIHSQHGGLPPVKILLFTVYEKNPHVPKPNFFGTPLLHMETSYHLPQAIPNFGALALCPLRLWRRLLQHYAFMCVHGRLQAERDRRRRCQQELLPGLPPSDEPLKAQRLSHRGIPAH